MLGAARLRRTRVPNISPLTRVNYMVFDLRETEARLHEQAHFAPRCQRQFKAALRSKSCQFEIRPLLLQTKDWYTISRLSEIHSFHAKTPEIHRVEDAQNARPPCWPWIQSSGQRFHAVTSSYQHDAASHSFLCKMSSSESDLSSSISSESSFLSIHDPLGDVENVDSSVGGSTTVFDDGFEGCCGWHTSSKFHAIEEQESSEFMERFNRQLMKP